MTKRKDSSKHQFRMRVPTHVVDQVRGRQIIIPLGSEVVETTIGKFVQFSLRTSDDKIAERRDRATRDFLQLMFDAAERGPIRLPHKQLVAMAGDVYRLYIEIHERDPGTTMKWAAHKAFSRAALEGRYHEVTAILPGQVDEGEADEAEATFGPGLTSGINALPSGDNGEALERRFGRLANWVLAQRCIELDEPTWLKFLEQVARATIDAGWTLKRYADGDYSPDETIKRFPPVEAGEGISLSELFEGWWEEAKSLGRKTSTYVSYKSTIESFATFLGHTDPRRVTEDDVLAFKNFRLRSINPRTGRQISGKTVKDSDLAALKSVFRWGVSNRKLQHNPALSVTLRLGRRRRDRSPGFTTGEAEAILHNALNYQPAPREHSKTAAAKRWLPWLCAYTGARIGEVAQLRKQDVRQEGPHWLMLITPEAGTVKTNEARTVVLHRHLVELGFPNFVQDCSDGPLFVKPKRDGSVQGPVKSLCNRLRDWIRTIVPDPRVQPNHGWRHRFPTIWREQGLDPMIKDMIEGRGPRTTGDGYGEATFAAMARALAVIPRYVTEPRGEHAEVPPL